MLKKNRFTKSQIVLIPQRYDLGMRQLTSVEKRNNYSKGLSIQRACPNWNILGSTYSS